MAELTGSPIGVFKLPIKLSEDERNLKKETLYKNTLHISEQQEILDQAKAVFKDETTMQKRESAAIVKELSQGFVRKEVRAIEQINDEDATREYYAEHTAELIHTEELSREEMKQYGIDFRALRNRSKLSKV